MIELLNASGSANASPAVLIPCYMEWNGRGRGRKTTPTWCGRRREPSVSAVPLSFSWPRHATGP